MNRQVILFCLLAAYATAIVILAAVSHKIELQMLLVLLTALTSIAFFLYRQHHYDAIFLKELMIYFNDRYDNIHKELTVAISEESSSKLNPNSREVILRYFNLCAEEHLFSNLGYIPKSVRKSWEKGISEYADSDTIRNYWNKEKNKGSYYGFTLDKYYK